MKIIVDADACPVKEEIHQIASVFGLEAIFIASYNHFSAKVNNEKWIYVDTKKEAADLRIVNLTSKEDIVITQDVGLASILLTKGAVVFSNRGELYQEKEMALMLERRYESAKKRRSGNYSKGPKPMTEADRQRFKSNLYAFLTSLK